jgi:hypothetical protein
MKKILFKFLVIVFISSSAIDSIGQKSDTSKIPKLNFFGSGNIQKSLDNGEKIPASTGLGVSYTHWFDTATEIKILHKVKFLKKITIDKLEIDAAINVAATVDTLKAKYDNNNVTNPSLFGSSILTPLNSGQAVKIGLRLNFKKSILAKTLIDGIKIKYIGSNRNWEVNDNGKTRVILGTNNYLRVGLFQEFLPKKLQDDYSINFGLYWAHNSIKGDIGQGINDQLRTKILGTDTKNFSGPEIALEIRLLNLRAEFGYSWLGADNEVPGLTGGRLLTTISFVGGFGLKLKD